MTHRVLWQVISLHQHGLVVVVSATALSGPLLAVFTMEPLVAGFVSVTALGGIHLSTALGGPLLADLRCCRAQLPIS